MQWKRLRTEVKEEIMKTDILCEIQFLPEQEIEAKLCAHIAIDMFRTFEKKYSRFQEKNELWHLNHATEITVSSELFDILKKAKLYYELSDGLFDPSILPILEHEGYTGAYQNTTRVKGDFSQLELDSTTLKVTKPRDLFIDLGGIGKGYIVDKVSNYLSSHFENFLVDAGGDIFAAGENKVDAYPYWAVEVERPHSSKESAVLLLKNKAVATSGTSRRHWKKDGAFKHHLIHPAKGEASDTDLVTVSVVAPSVTDADVYAKTLFLLGKEKGIASAETLSIPALFIDTHDTIIRTTSFSPYVWKA